jgi:hypothetical protein
MAMIRSLCSTIRGYLMRYPRPTHVRVTSPGNKQTNLEIPQKRVNWQTVAESIEALEPELLEFFEHEKFLRAVSAEQLDDKDENAAPPAESRAPLSIEHDPETARIIKFAELLADAHKTGYEKVAFAFERLADIVESVTTASSKKDQFIDSMQRAYNRVLQENAELVAEAGGEDGNGDPMEFMMRAFMAGAMQRQAEHAAQQRTGVPPNGSGQHPPTPPRTQTRAKA